MTTILSIIVIGFISAIFGFSMLMQVHGQLTPEQLQERSNEDSNLRQQYWNYFVSHNITTYENIGEINQVDVFDLERQVKLHIEDCRTGKHARDVQTMEEYGKRYPYVDPDHGGELYYYFGETRDGFDVIIFRGDLGECTERAPQYDAPVKPYEKGCYYHQELDKKICPNDPEYGK
jgi:hypothetical protein